MMTLQNFRDAVDRNAGGRGLPDTVLDQHINAALLEVANSIGFHELRKVAALNTEAGTRAYEWLQPNEGVFDIHDVTPDGGTGGRRLTHFELHNLPPREDMDEDKWAAPEKWARVSNHLVFTPTPDDVYNLEVYYKSLHSVLADPQDSTLFSPSWDQAIVLNASAYAMLSVGESTLYDRWFQRYIAYMQTREETDDHAAPSLGVEVPRTEADITEDRSRRPVKPVDDLV